MRKLIQCSLEVNGNGWTSIFPSEESCRMWLAEMLALCLETDDMFTSSTTIRVTFR